MEGKKYLCLNDIGAYKLSYNLSNYVWNLVIKWDFLSKDTVGKQFIRSSDSISANIAEGFARHSKKDKIKFYYYSLGSVMETKDWSQKAFKRNLISIEQYNCIFKIISQLPKEINYLIIFTKEKLTM